MSYAIPKPTPFGIDIAIEDDPGDREAQPYDRFLAYSRGVIHVGANIAQEAALYDRFSLPVIWIEAVPELVKAAETEIAAYPNQRVIQGLVTDKDGAEYTFGIASNGQSSSIYDMKDHAKAWPSVHYVGSVKMRSVTLPTLLKGVDLTKYDTLVMDVQGAELLVLKGAESILPGFKYIRSEATDFEAYAGGATRAALDEYLTARGFEVLEACEMASRPDLGACYEVIYAR